MARVIDRVASDRPLPGGDAVVMPMPRRPTQMARTCIIARSRAALLRPACAIERAAVGAVDDGDRAARLALAIIGTANDIRQSGKASGGERVCQYVWISGVPVS